jgi:hypothetical protein
VKLVDNENLYFVTWELMLNWELGDRPKIYGCANSYAKFYGIIDFRPYGNPGFTKWSLWPGVNYTRLETDDDLSGGARLYKIGNPPDLDGADLSSVGIDLGSDFD